MEKNKKILLIVMIVLAVVAIIVSIILLKPKDIEKEQTDREIEQTEKNKSKKEKEYKNNAEYFNESNLLIQKVYINGIDYTTKGSFITTDGYIYEYSLDESSETAGTLESMIDNSTKLDKTVSEEDLKTIKKLINNLKDEREDLPVNEDLDTMIMTEVYNYQGPILLKSEGNTASENITNESQELIQIIDKYIK